MATPKHFPPTYGTLQVSMLADVSLRQLQWWDEKRVVFPRHEGHSRVYTKEDVIEILVLAALRRRGVSLQRIRKLLECIKRNMNHRRFGALVESPGDYYLLVDGDTALIREREHVFELLKRARRAIILVPISEQAKRIKGLAA